MIADGVEIGIVLEPKFEVASHLLQASFQQVYGLIDFAQQRISAGGIVMGKVVIGINC